MPWDIYNALSGEENDDICHAFPIRPHMTHHFIPDDLHDWYVFELDSSGHLVVELTNFQPVAGQIAIYKGNGCKVTGPAMANNGDFSTTKTLDLGQQSRGRYFLYVSNDGPPNASDPYQLYVGSP